MPNRLKATLYTPYQSQYWAHALTLRVSGGEIAALSRSIANARVDLNPHQVDAALFALHSPFTNGAVLADEVGLGKTVEAGIFLAQKWAERRRRILLVVPAMLRTKWQQELSEKFYLPSEPPAARMNCCHGAGVAPLRMWRDGKGGQGRAIPAGIGG